MNRKFEFGSAVFADGALNFEPMFFDNPLFSFWFFAFLFSFALSFVFLFVYFKYGKRLKELNAERDAKYRSKKASYVARMLFGDSAAKAQSDKHDSSAGLQRQWEKVKKYARSEKFEDKKLAIFEADKLLNELLKSRGYTDGTLGEKLKKLSEKDFPPLEDAWRAHKFRNKLVHELDELETDDAQMKEALLTYEKVFKYFGFL